MNINQENIMKLAQATLKNFDNLFTANHRLLMQTRYGATEAEFIPVEFLGATNDERKPQWLPTK